MKDILDNLMNGIKGEINSCILAKIESFDPEKLTANVIPMTRQLDRTGKTKELSMLINIPVATIQTENFIIRPPYKKGDIVVMVIADSDIEGTIITGEISDPNTKRKHSLDDGIIIGGFKALNNTLPSEHSEDLVIANKSFGTKVVLKSNGDVEILGNNIDVKAGSDIKVEAGGVLDLIGSIVNVKGSIINLN